MEVFFNPILLVAWAQDFYIAGDLHEEYCIMISITATGFPKSIMATEHVSYSLSIMILFGKFMKKTFHMFVS